MGSKAKNISKHTDKSLSKLKFEDETVSEETLEEWATRPEFIYGGPFIKPATKPPFMDGNNPFNSQLSGIYKMSYAYRSLTERMPVILTKVIDYCSKNMEQIKADAHASDDDVKNYIKYVVKLKNDLVTNKLYEQLTVDTPNAKKWNDWIDAQEQKTYFTNTWVFTECYIYRRLREASELYPNLEHFDPFESIKEKSFHDNLEPMCIVADKLMTMLPKSEKDQRKQDFITLLKLSLWANKCDLSLSAGSSVNVLGEKQSLAEIHSDAVIDPFQMIIDFKDKIIADDSNKISDAVVNKAEALAKKIEENTTFKQKCSCHRLAKIAGMTILQKPPEDDPPEEKPAEEKPPEAKKSQSTVAFEEEAPIPCPAKITIPSCVMFDIICDNAGYELFTDLCLAHFLIEQEIVQKVRFHVKQIPWFVSDVVHRDFAKTMDMCAGANYTREIPASETEPITEARTIDSKNLNKLGEQWIKFLMNGTWELMAEDYWSSPLLYKDMKRLDYNLYRKLQLGCALLFKGDLNYRKLLGEKKVSPISSLESALQGFIPAPIIAVRTVKSEVVCGLAKAKGKVEAKYNALAKIDPNWMEKGEYGVIQFCAKGEALKVSTRPCLDYGITCFGEGCPKHSDM